MSSESNVGGRAKLGAPSMSSTEGILTKVVTEIKYAKGMVYLDRCGSLALQLQATLGENFRVSVPGMEYAQLDSALERIAVTFGRNAFRVEQTGPASGVRVEKLTTEGWDCVAESLDVRSSVLRFGVRVFNVWPTSNVTVARNAIRATGLVAASSAWESHFGEPSWASYSANTLTDRGRVRRCLDEIEHTIEGLLPEGFAEYLPAAGVQYDVDYVYRREMAPFGLKRDQVRDFVRSSWNSFLADRAKIGATLALKAEVQ